MKTFFKGMKRCVAMLLAMVMILSAGNVQAIAQLIAPASTETVRGTTLSELILSNYQLSAEEEAIIGSGWLSADKGYTYVLPPEEVADGGLIEVDEDNKKITVSAYEDSQGNTWIPVSFDLKNAQGVIAGHDDLALTKEGNLFVGTYTATDNQFSVEATYKLEITATEDEQKALLEAGEKLAADIDVLKVLDTADIFAAAGQANASKVAQIRDLMEEALGQQATLTPALALMFMVAKVLDGKSAVDVIHGLTTENKLDLSSYGLGTYDLYMKSGKAKDAAGRLLNQQSANNNLDLAKYLVMDHAADSYLEWLMVYGDALKAALNTNYDDLYFLGNQGNGLSAVSNELELLLEDLGEGDAVIFNVVNQMIRDNGLSYTITSEQQLTNLINDLKTARQNKLDELNNTLATLGYTGETITTADQIDDAVTFLEGYDPYPVLQEQVRAELLRMGFSSMVVNFIKIEKDEDFETVYTRIDQVTGEGKLLTQKQADDAKADLEEVRLQTKAFVDNRESYVQMLKDGKTSLQQVDTAIPLLEELQTQLPTLRAELDAQREAAKENKAMLDMLIFVMQQLCKTLEPVYTKVNAGNWETPTVVDTTKAVNYDLLTAKAQNLQTTSVALKEKLDVATATVRYNMSMFNVRVVVKAAMVNPLLVDSAETIALTDYESAVVTLRKDADKQEVMEAIAALGADAAALAQWEGLISETNYVRTADVLAEDFALTADLTYVVSYAPKMINITYGEGFDAGHGMPAAVPFGYKLTLPAYPDASSEYVYTVAGVENLDQGLVIKVGSDLEISRKVGAMSEKQYLTTLVVKTNPNMDTALKNIYQSDAIAKGNSFSIVVPKNENLEIYFDEVTRQVVIKAEPVVSRVGELKWTANSGRLDTTPITLVGGIHNTTESFQMAYVDYELDLTTAALGISDAELLKVMNIPSKLTALYTKQYNALQGLAGQLSYLTKINNYDTVETPLGTNTVPQLLRSVAALARDPGQGFLDTTAEAAISLATLIETNGMLPITVTLDAYQAAGVNGVYDFYINEVTYLSQINELYDLLNLVVKDNKLMGLLPAEYDQGFKSAQAALEEAYKLNGEYAIDHDTVIVREDTKTALRNLLSTLHGLMGTEVAEYTAVPSEMTWVQTVSGISPGNSAIIINVYFDGMKYSDTSWSVATGSDLDRAELESRIAALNLEAGLTAQLQEHYIRTMTGDKDLVSGSQTIEVTWTAKEYPVYVDGQELGTVTIDGGKIQLPAHPTTGYVYEYTIGGEVTRANEYNFSTAKVLDMLTDGKITITRTEINVQETALINRANSLGVTLVKDPQEGYIMILPLDMSNIEDSIMDFALGLFGSGSSSIKLGDATLMNNGQYYLKTLVDAVLYSGIDSDRMLALIDENGNVVSDLTVPAELIINGRNGGKQGGTLLKTTMTFDNEAPLTFYITLTGSGATLQTARKAIALAQKGGVEFALRSGMVQVIADLPDTVYAAYVGALTMVGEADIDNINELNAEVAVGYLIDMVINAIDGDVTGKTLSNTIALTGREYAVSDRLVSALQTALQSKNFRYNNDPSVTYMDLYGLPISAVLDRLQAKVDAMELPAGMTAPKLSNLIAEYSTGLNLTFKADVKNLDEHYVAMSVNAAAAKALDIHNAVAMLTADDLSRVAEGNAVILLDNVGTPENPVALTLNKSVVLDLNGKTVYGSITANGGRSYIIDSDYGADAYVTGAVTGKNLTILGGKYDADVTANLRTGYQQVNGVVRNKYFTIIQEGNDVFVTLNLIQAREIATKDHLINLALDIASELAITHYNGTAAMTVDGKTLFDLNVDNALSILTGGDRLNAAIDTVLGCVSAPQLAELVDVLVADMTNFTKLETALKTDGILASYDFTTSSWEVVVDHNTEKDIIDVSIGSGAIAKEGTLKLVVGGEYNEELAKLAAALAETTTIKSDFTNVKEVAREGNRIVVAGDYEGSFVMDFSKDYRYPVTMAVILAAGNPAIRAQLVEAIENFYDTGCTNQDKLEVCFDKLTLQQVITALKNNDHTEPFTKTAARIGLSEETLKKVQAFGNDEMGFRMVVDVAGIALRKYAPGIDGTLSALKKTDENGQEYYGIDKSASLSKDLSAKGYIADIDANITELKVALYLFDDHVHVPGTPVEENYVGASCTEPGSYDLVTYCSVCGDKLKTEHKDIPATGHSFTNYVSNNDATCFADGTKTATCDNGCGEKDTVTDEGTKLEHKFTNYVSDGNATCMEDGTKTAECDHGCGTKDTVTDEGSKLEHKFTNYVSNGDATCEEDGTKTAECDYGCGTKDTIADEGSKLEHKFTNYVSNGDATCEADGTKTATCDNGCGKTDTITDEGSKLPHGPTTLVGYKPADYEIPGYTGDLVCDKCGHVVEQGTEIPALVYEIVVTDANGQPLYKGADLEAALNAAQDGATVTINAPVTQIKDLTVSKAITIVGADKIDANGKKITLTDPAAKITADAALNVFSGVDGYIVKNDNNVYTMKEIAAPTADNTVAGVKVESDDTAKYLFLDLEPVEGKTLASLQTSLTFADLNGYTVKLAIAGNDGTGLVKTADTMIVTATDANGNVVATITYTVVVMGDVNCDGMAWSNDATAVMQIFFGGVNATKPMLLAADITCDGTIETPLIHSTDAQRIMHKYFSWGLTQGGYESALR